MDWLKDIAPTLFKALTNPGGAALDAAVFIAKKFGWDISSVDEAKEKLNGLSPEQTLQLKNIDLEFEKEFSKQVESLSKADIEVSKTNQIEAQSENWLSKNWRPLTGFLFGVGSFFALMCQTFLVIVRAYGYISQQADIHIPIDTFIFLLSGMLGMGVYRTIDKRIKT